jgi:hypothetical protein
MRPHTNTHIRLTRLKPGQIDFLENRSDAPLKVFAQRLRVRAYQLRARHDGRFTNAKFSVICCPETNEASILRLQ